jgi:hypothetical protein
MNCERVQERIIEALASGESEIHEEERLHLQSCAGCRAFLAKQTELFQAIDSHLQVIANEPVPPSLLAGLRVRLQEEVPPRPSWILAWRPVAIAALVVLTAVVGIQFRRWSAPTHAVESSPLVAQKPSSGGPKKPTEAPLLVPLPESAPPRVKPKANLPAPSSAPEVLILQEEQEAFAHFVAELSSDRDAAVALASVVPAKGDTPMEIALLTIESVEVKPLEGSGAE